MESLYNKVGISYENQAGTVPLGIDANGKQLYGSSSIVNDNTPNVAGNLTTQYKNNLNAIGAASEKDNEYLDKLKTTVSDPKTLQTLDAHRASGSSKEFTTTLAKTLGTSDPAQSKAAYDAWGVMTPNQKGVMLLHLSGKEQEYGSKEFLPGVNTQTALDLQKQGIPMKSVKGNWQQVSALKDGISHNDSTDNVAAIKQVARAGFLGTAQNLSQSDQNFYKTSPAPQYGVGALEMPQNGSVPTGYSVAGTQNGKQVIVPQGNEASVAYNPSVNGTAGAIYQKWEGAGKLPATNGSTGGSNMYKGLTTLYDTNPKALGTALDKQIPGKGTFVDKAHGLTTNVLTTGKIEGTKATTKEAALTTLGKAGIQSKDVGYKLANQAYAEGRINDSHLFTIQRSLDDLFHNDKALNHIAPTTTNTNASSKNTDSTVKSATTTSASLASQGGV